ncbi:MAG: nucleotidyltransferase family protein [bacterium]
MKSIRAFYGDAIVHLCRQYGVQSLEIFGSAAAEIYDPGCRDVDFLVQFSPCSPVEHYERYFNLLESLEELPKKTVDLVETAAVRNPYLARQIHKQTILLYAA